MVAEWEGDALLEEMNASSYEATFVPINCIESLETKQTQSLSRPRRATRRTSRRIEWMGVRYPSRERRLSICWRSSAALHW